MDLKCALLAVLVGVVGMPGCVTPSTSAQGASSDAPQTAAQPAALDDTVLVRVVRRDDQTALVGARVSYLQPVGAQGMRTDTFGTVTTEECLVSNGGLSTVLTDAHGEARIPRPSAAMRLEVTLGELWNETTIDPQATTVVLPLDRDEVWDAELVDESKQPLVGARVCLFVVAKDGNERFVSASRAQGPNAAVELVHMQKARELGRTPPVLRLQCALPGLNESHLTDCALGFGPDGGWQFRLTSMAS